VHIQEKGSRGSHSARDAAYPCCPAQVVADIQTLFDQELASKPGTSATGIKVACAGWVDQLQPFWQGFNASGSEFGDTSPSGACRGIGVRGGATTHVEVALPTLGAMVQRYT
jgi:hypothetical protein